MVKYKKDKIKLKPKERILKTLIENKEPQSILSISNSAAVDYKNTYKIIKDLLTSGIIISQIIGNIKPVRLNISTNQEIFSVEEKRTEDFLSKNPKLKLIRQDIEEIDYPFMVVLIFGSYAKNTKTENSDIDLCIISDNKEKREKLIRRLSLLSLKLEIQDFTTKEFISMIEKTQRNLGHEIVKSNVILYGIENYYNLISKWMKKE